MMRPTLKEAARWAGTIFFLVTSPLWLIGYGVFDFGRGALKMLRGLHEHLWKDQ